MIDEGGRFLGIARQEAVQEALDRGDGELTVRSVLADGETAGWHVEEDRPLTEVLSSESLGRLGALMAVDAGGRPARRGHDRAGPAGAAVGTQYAGGLRPSVRVAPRGGGPRSALPAGGQKCAQPHPGHPPWAILARRGHRRPAPLRAGGTLCNFVPGRPDSARHGAPERPETDTGSDPQSRPRRRNK